MNEVGLLDRNSSSSFFSHKPPLARGYLEGVSDSDLTGAWPGKAHYYSTPWHDDVR